MFGRRASRRVPHCSVGRHSLHRAAHSRRSRSACRAWRVAGTTRSDSSTPSISATRATIWASRDFYEIDRSRRTAEVGYWLRDEAVGHGYMSEALAVLCRPVFSRLALARIEALVQPGNERSLKTTESAGFHFAGLFPDDGSVTVRIPTRCAGTSWMIPNLWARHLNCGVRYAATNDAEAIAPMQH